MMASIADARLVYAGQIVLSVGSPAPGVTSSKHYHTPGRVERGGPAVYQDSVRHGGLPLVVKRGGEPRPESLVKYAG